MPTAIIFDIKRFAVHDGPGIRTTVFLKGCPLRCWWCHNPESQAKEPYTVDIERKVNGQSIPGRKTYGEKIEVAALMETLLKDRHFYEESGGGITFSGGEPMMQADALAVLLEECKKNGLHTIVDTSGFAKCEQFERILDHTDLFLYDLKNMDPELHKKYTGVDNGLIQSNADFLLESGAQIIFRIPVIPGISTSDDEVNRMVFFIEERKEYLKEVHLLPYHRISENKYFRLRMKQQLPEVKEPDQKFMWQLKEKFEKTGLDVFIGG
ncbi:MAG: glycyl-radical enzyme activating protein [Bacteroidales bacterium]|nr:glycyl-radical enzyme activating protein [Bacteroidales bacterium]